LGFEWLLNKKETPKQTLFNPVMPAFTRWYLFKFRSRLFTICACGLVIFGVLLTKFNAPHWLIGVVTFIFVGFPVFLGVLHTIAWVKMRRAEKKL
jgi:hypothetical protein